MGGISVLKTKYPAETAIIGGARFPYRYYKNTQSTVTVALLTGGLGIADVMLPLFDELAGSYSVLTFDYPMAYATNQALSDAIAALIQSLGIKVFLLGQSFGGFLAQILAKQHPEVVEGLILSNTGTLSTRLDECGAQSLFSMLEFIDQLVLLCRRIPFRLAKKGACRIILKNAYRKRSEAETKRIAAFCDEVILSLTKDYEIHMALLLCDLQNHWNIEEGDVACYRGKVLLMLADDDHTFNGSVRQALIDLMPGPHIITDIRGGHLSIFLKPERYAAAVSAFIDAIE